jgi:anthranilate 1,2-dioxygenase small subunit/terephthalate 1,2-dioxygenase oxygenase component beta subunit
MDFELRAQIEDLHARYCHALDTDALEAWPDFFTEKGVYRITTAENEARGLPMPVLYCEGRAMLRDRIASLRHANIYEPQRYRHIVSSLLVGEKSGNAVKASASFLVVRIMDNGEATFFASGRYEDTIALPAMKLEQRVVVCDSRRFDTLLAIPL